MRVVKTINKSQEATVTVAAPKALLDKLSCYETLSLKSCLSCQAFLLLKVKNLLLLLSQQQVKNVLVVGISVN